MNKGNVTISVGEPIATKDRTSKDKHDLAKILQEEVAKLLNV